MLFIDPLPKKYALAILPDGTYNWVYRRPTLKELQTTVNGNIEGFQVTFGLIGYCNEEGRWDDTFEENGPMTAFMERTHGPGGSIFGTVVLMDARTNQDGIHPAFGDKALADLELIIQYLR